MTAKLDAQTLELIQDLFERFEREMKESNYSANSIAQRVSFVRNFVGWLGGTYSPSDYDGSQATR